MSEACDLNSASAVFHLMTSGEFESLPVDCLIVTFVTNDVSKSLPSQFFDAEFSLIIFIKLNNMVPPIFSP